ncbi:hypothetical protein DM01DRAFT_1147646 [Hesseltinella vesiculosa]|uniref:Uncharacterized protein n=1 Tax=Hesseltinella vesiculosa TaxID=101127 RepID=A0A1X2G716_9FUNG|nr:hypothetical protein DM01DRAFT_1147646 [Hesseltinella vesiculosa]
MPPTFLHRRTHTTSGLLRKLLWGSTSVLADGVSLVTGAGGQRAAYQVLGTFLKFGFFFLQFPFFAPNIFPFPISNRYDPAGYLPILRF